MRKNALLESKRVYLADMRVELYLLKHENTKYFITFFFNNGD